MEITQVQNLGDSAEYLLHRTNPKDTVQYRLYGKQNLVQPRIYHIERLRSVRDLGNRCREKAAFSREQSKAQAVKCVVLFLMTNPPVYRNKTSLIKALKQFAKSKSILVSEKKLAEQYTCIRGLVK